MREGEGREINEFRIVYLILFLSTYGICLFLFIVYGICRV